MPFLAGREQIPPRTGALLTGIHKADLESMRRWLVTQGFSQVALYHAGPPVGLDCFAKVWAGKILRIYLHPEGSLNFREHENVLAWFVPEDPAFLCGARTFQEMVEELQREGYPEVRA
jgi:hypothetical protein